jgi:hypothetical protein
LRASADLGSSDADLGPDSGRSFSRVRAGSATAFGPAESCLVSAWNFIESNCQSAGLGRDVLPCADTGGFDLSLVSKGSAQSSEKTGSADLLASSDSAWAGIGFFAKSILKIWRQDMSFLKELWKYMKVRKKFWLLPIVLVFLLLGGLIILSQGSVVAPFIYTLF